MIADALAANAGVWYFDEPFAVFPTHHHYELKCRHLPQLPDSQFMHLSAEHLEQFGRYVDQLLNVRIRQLGTCRRTLPVLRAERVALKVLNAPWMLDWFVEHTDAHVLALLRHPAAQALSVIRQQWQSTTATFVDRAADLEAYFTAAQFDAARAALVANDAWKLAILEWIFTTEPLRRCTNPNVALIHYETVVREPETLVDDVLIGRCGLTDRAAMLEALGRPSGSSSRSTAATIAHISRGDRTKLTHGWVQYIKPDQAAEGQALLDLFEVTEFSMFEQAPTHNAQETPQPA